MRSLDFSITALLEPSTQGWPFFGNNPSSLLLYLWEMLHKYQLLSTAFSELGKKMSAKNGGKGVPLVINKSVLFESDVDNEWDLLDTGSTLASSGKK